MAFAVLADVDAYYVIAVSRGGPIGDSLSLFKLDYGCFDRLLFRSLGNRYPHQLAVMRKAAVAEYLFIKDDFKWAPFGAAALKVGQGYDADQMPVSVDNRKPLNMRVAHESARLFDRVLLRTANRVQRHRFTYPHVIGVAVVRHTAHRDVSVRNHSEQSALLAYR
jgi:hypothetical protein